VSIRREEKNRRRAARRGRARRRAQRVAPRRARWLVARLVRGRRRVRREHLAVDETGEHATAPSHHRRDRRAGAHDRALARGIHVLPQRLAGLALPAQSDSAYHIHAFPSVFINNRQITIPTNLGIDPNLRFLSPVHTHDSTGIIHIEASRPYPSTLGQLFTIWGVTFSDSQFGAYRDAGARRLAVFANGRPVRDPGHYVVRRHDSIVVGYGTPASFPHGIAVTFPPGLQRMGAASTEAGAARQRWRPCLECVETNAARPSSVPRVTWRPPAMRAITHVEGKAIGSS
jgi:hypothetical protein